MKDFKNYKAPTKSTLKIYVEIFISSLLFVGFFATAWVAMAVL